MSIKEYFEFVRWMVSRTNKDFDIERDNYFERLEENPKAIVVSVKGLDALSHLSGRGRMVVLIIFLIIIISCVIASMCPIDVETKYYLLGSAGLYLVFGVYGGCRFSLIYYAIIYPVYANRNRSLNDNVIFYQKMLGKTHEPVHKTIAKYFKVFRGKMTYRYAEFHLVDKTKKNPPNNTKVYMSLRFTSKAVFFNGEKVFDGRMTDLSQLKECLENIIASGKSVPIQHKK
jgi:hypothetical protein